MATAARRERDAALALVIECLRPAERLDLEHAADLMARTTGAAIAATADHHGVAATIREPLARVAAAPPDLLRTLEQRANEALQHHLLILWELAHLRPVLEGSGARWAVIKGPVLAELVYDAPDQRFYGDLDVLVGAADFGDVIAALLANGSRVLDRNWRVMRRQLHGQVHVELPGGSLLDLHWDLVNLYRGRLRIDTARILERVERVEMAGGSTPTLEATDSLVHLALHGTLSGGDRLRWITDVAMTAQRRPPDWDELVRRAEAWRAGSPVGYLLRRARDTLGADIPDGLPERLLGRRYAAILRVTDRLFPWERAGGRLTSPSLAITRSMAYGPGGAIGWLARRGARSLDPREPRASSTFTPGGGADEFHAYLRAVADTAGRR